MKIVWNNKYKLHHGRYNNSKEIENTVQGNPIISDWTVKNLLNYN